MDGCMGLRYEGTGRFRAAFGIIVMNSLFYDSLYKVVHVCLPMVERDYVRVQTDGSAGGERRLVEPQVGGIAWTAGT